MSSEQALELTDKDDIKNEQSMLQGIIRFGDETAKEVMTSRQNIVDLDIQSTYAEVLKCIVENNYSRIPCLSGQYGQYPRHSVYQGLAAPFG